MSNLGAGDVTPIREAPSSPHTTHYRKNTRVTLSGFPAFRATVRSVCPSGDNEQAIPRPFCNALTQSVTMETTESLLGRGPKWSSRQVSEPGSFYRNDPPSTLPTTFPTFHIGQLLISLVEGEDVLITNATSKVHRRPLSLAFAHPLFPLPSPSLSISTDHTPILYETCPCSPLRLGFKLKKGAQQLELEGTLGTSCSCCREIQRPKV